MKSPKPWFWKARNAWYVQINGKQKKLHEDEKLAHKEFYRIMAAEGLLDEKQSKAIGVADAAEAMLESVQHLRPSSRRIYNDNLGVFSAQFANRRLDSMRADECVRFAREYKGRSRKIKFGDASRHLLFRIIKTFFGWARDTGLIQINPLHGKENPWKVMARKRQMTEAEYLAIMADRKTHDRFKEVLEFLWKTGARPGEIACIHARHLDANMPIVRLQPSEHKTGTKTGLQREIVMPPDLMARLRAYALKRPKGHLLLTRKGKPWTQPKISEAFRCVARRLGFDGLVIHMARHAFISRLLDRGEAPATVAKLVGHSGTVTIQRVYYHPDLAAMMEMVDKSASGESEKLKVARESCEADRRRHRSTLRDAQD